MKWSSLSHDYRSAIGLNYWPDNVTTAVTKKQPPELAGQLDLNAKITKRFLEVSQLTAHATSQNNLLSRKI